jgi:hypothetical protein
MTRNLIETTCPLCSQTANCSKVPSKEIHRFRCGCVRDFLMTDAMRRYCRKQNAEVMRKILLVLKKHPKSSSTPFIRRASNPDGSTSFDFEIRWIKTER